MLINKKFKKLYLDHLRLYCMTFVSNKTKNDIGNIENVLNMDIILYKLVNYKFINY